MTAVVIVIACLAAVTLVAAVGWALWRYDHSIPVRGERADAARQLAEQRIDAMTRRTIAAMRQVVRDDLAARYRRDKS